jgi:hypothetical protein
MNRPGKIFLILYWLIIPAFFVLVTGCGERTDNKPATANTETVAIKINGGLDGLGKGPTPVLLGTAGDYVILAKSAILTRGGSTVAGNLGVSPADKASDLPLLSEPIQFSSAPQVSGHIFAADNTIQSPIKLTKAIADMRVAYADAASRKPDFIDVGAGIIGGMTLAPGTYQWSTAILIPASITLNGGPNDVWIFQVSRSVIQASAARVLLSGGARAKNIYWQVAGTVNVKSLAHTEGVIMSQGGITLGKGATANSRLLAQTTVSLDANVVTQPAP